MSTRQFASRVAVVVVACMVLLTGYNYSQPCERPVSNGPRVIGAGPADIPEHSLWALGGCR